MDLNDHGTGIGDDNGFSEYENKDDVGDGDTGDIADDGQAAANDDAASSSSSPSLFTSRS